jgi:hypothetical protein
MALVGVVVFFGSLGLVWAGGWSFEYVTVPGRGIALAVGYLGALAGVAMVFYAVVRSELQPPPRDGP